MKTVYGDGTFKIASPLFAQIYFILAKRQGFVFPVLYALLPNKKQQTYMRLFNEIHREWPEFEPDSLSIDYEIAVIHAFTEVFPDTHYFGCLFHLHQNMKKHVEQAELIRQYRTDAIFAQQITNNCSAYIRFDMLYKRCISCDGELCRRPIATDCGVVRQQLHGKTNW
jgi:hypothetical protein